jgi:hypothetical protein
VIKPDVTEASIAKKQAMSLDLSKSQTAQQRYANYMTNESEAMKGMISSKLTAPYFIAASVLSCLFPLARSVLAVPTAPVKTCVCTTVQVQPVPVDIEVS